MIAVVICNEPCRILILIDIDNFQTDDLQWISNLWTYNTTSKGLWFPMLATCCFVIPIWHPCIFTANVSNAGMSSEAKIICLKSNMYILVVRILHAVCLRMALKIFRGITHYTARTSFPQFQHGSRIDSSLSCMWLLKNWQHLWLDKSSDIVDATDFLGWLCVIDRKRCNIRLAAALRYR